MFVRAREAKLLNAGPAKIVTTALGEINRIVAHLTACSTKATFIEQRKKLFPDYVNLSYIIANSFSISDDRAVRRRAINQSIKAVERFFETRGVSRFGEDAVREAIFCLDTLRRAYRLVDVIHHSGPIAESLLAADRECATSFNGSALWSQIHIDCLRVALSEQNPLNGDVLDEILQGSRLSVMAYSYVRQGVELRRKTEAQYLLNAQRDDEDEELLEESFLDYADNESSQDVES
jgi:hypothetical protein